MAKKKDKKDKKEVKLSTPITIDTSGSSPDVPIEIAEDLLTDTVIEPLIETKGEEVVEVPKSVLEGVLETQKDMKKEIERLTYAADKARIGHFDSKTPTEIVPTARIGRWFHEEVKYVVVGWQMIRNDVYVEPSTGKVIENQVIKMFLHDPSKEVNEANIINVEVEYIAFMRNMIRDICNIVKTSVGPDGDTRTLQMSDGKEYELDVRFINP